MDFKLTNGLQSHALKNNEIKIVSNINKIKTKLNFRAVSQNIPQHWLKRNNNAQFNRNDLVRGSKTMSSEYTAL